MLIWISNQGKKNGADAAMTNLRMETHAWYSSSDSLFLRGSYAATPRLCSRRSIVAIIKNGTPQVVKQIKILNKKNQIAK